jgi:hypothetical protein
MRTTTWMLLAAALPGCKHADPALVHRDPVAETGIQPVTTASTPEVQIAFAGEHAERPPLVTVLLDVTLQNPAAAPRWFLIPATFGSGTDLQGGSVNSAAIRAGRGGGRALVGHFSGQSAFHALLLPAGATVAITHLPVELWYGARPDALSFEVVIADRFSIGGAPGEAWFGQAAASDGAVRVAYEALELVSSRSSSSFAEEPVELGGEARVPVTIALPGG